LSFIDPLTFAGLPLQILRLSFNKIVTINVNTFNGLSSLNLLDLSSNKIVGLFPNTFKGLGSLIFINLENNQIVTVDKNLFVGLSSLYKVCLYGNTVAEYFPTSLVNICPNPFCQIETAQPCEQ